MKRETTSASFYLFLLTDSNGKKYPLRGILSYKHFKRSILFYPLLAKRPLTYRKFNSGSRIEKIAPM